MLREMTAEELEAECPTYIALKAADLGRTKALLKTRLSRVEEDEAGFLRVYDMPAQGHDKRSRQKKDHYAFDDIFHLSAHLTTYLFL